MRFIRFAHQSIVLSCTLRFFHLSTCSSWWFLKSSLLSSWQRRGKWFVIEKAQLVGNSNIAENRRPGMMDYVTWYMSPIINGAASRWGGFVPNIVPHTSRLFRVVLESNTAKHVNPSATSALAFPTTRNTPTSASCV